MKKSHIEMVVGMFILAGFAALVYLAFNLGEVSILSAGQRYTVQAEFVNVAGIKKGASVQVAGVGVGKVTELSLVDEYANLTLRIDNDIKIPRDSMASVKSQGIIGDKFIQISLGGDEEMLAEGDVIVDTESSVDIESLISKFAFGSAN
ncbi:MAG: outer membrane lipid asymmetry maintenance protein MlaD [Desulfopila sp.]